MSLGCCHCPPAAQYSAVDIAVDTGDTADFGFAAVLFPPAALLYMAAALFPPAADSEMKPYPVLVVQSTVVLWYSENPFPADSVHPYSVAAGSAAINYSAAVRPDFAVVDLNSDTAARLPAPGSVPWLLDSSHTRAAYSMAFEAAVPCMQTAAPALGIHFALVYALLPSSLSHQSPQLRHSFP